MYRQWAAREPTMVFDRPNAAASHSVGQNKLLLALPDKELGHVYPHLDAIELKPGDIPYETHARSCYIYFPTTSIVSLQYTLDDGASIEIAMAGNDGLVGYPLIMGGNKDVARKNKEFRRVLCTAKKPVFNSVSKLRAEVWEGTRL